MLAGMVLCYQQALANQVHMESSLSAIKQNVQNAWLHHHNETSWWKWKPDDKPKPKPKKSVPLPATLLPLGAGLSGFMVWRTIRRRARNRQEQQRRHMPK